jgi:hypothetical protein
MLTDDDHPEFFNEDGSLNGLFLKQERDSLRKKQKKLLKLTAEVEQYAVEDPGNEDIKELLVLIKEEKECILAIASLLEQWEAHNENVD